MLSRGRRAKREGDVSQSMSVQSSAYKMNKKKMMSLVTHGGLLFSRFPPRCTKTLINTEELSRVSEVSFWSSKRVCACHEKVLP